MVSGDLRVRGGAGGTAVQLEELDVAVVRLGTSAAALHDAALDLELGRSLLDGLAGLAAGPGGVLALEGDVVTAVRRLHDGSEEEGQLAVAVALAVEAYRSAEDAVGGLWVVTRFGAVAGSPLLLGTAVAALPATGALLQGEGSGGAPVEGETAPGGAGPLGSGTGGGPSAGVRLADPGLLLAALLGTAVGGAGAVVSGRSPSPRIAQGLVEVGALSGTADATRVTTARVPVPTGVATAGPPSGTGMLMGRVKQVSDSGSDGRVRVEVVTAADGRRSAVVYMPGVQDWDGDSRNPISGGTALRAEAGLPSAYTDLVVQALEDAGVAPDEPVMLAGHSLGGIAAAQVAGDPAVTDRFHITTVMTAGAPIGAADIPSDVTVLAMENSGDPVVALDLAPNPDAANVTTVVAPTSVAFSQHSSGPYVDLAERVDASDEPSLVAWREHIAPFLASPGATSVVTEVAGRTVDPTPHG